VSVDTVPSNTCISMHNLRYLPCKQPYVSMTCKTCKVPRTNPNDMKILW